MKKTYQFLTLFITTITLFSCDKTDYNKALTASYKDCIFVANAGPYGNGTGTISLFHKDLKNVEQDFYAHSTGNIIGNLLQSITLANDNAYMVVNNANKVEVCNLINFHHVFSIGGLVSPRYIIPINDSVMYISQWGNGASSIQVYNNRTYSITNSIALGNGAENMVKVGNVVYVNCVGGLTSDNRVYAINTLNDAIIATITVGANPQSLQVDANNNVWVLCMGQMNASYTQLTTKGSLQRINTLTNTVDENFTFNSNVSQPTNLKINAANNKLYYLYNGAVCTQNTASTVLDSTKIVNRNFYCLGIDPSNENIVAADALDYVSNGKVVRYTSAGTALDSFTAGVIPTDIKFY